ncbi:hypothetical protein [Streptomyces sp. YS415]|uniref:hypothetical protein n=1 Tax=Streptomyces sp. YS415 TaxID=2944806 RepID=UPI002020DD84|nr:hypothetical protein [Streptomyces sp. YS415]MCL7430527.1 hypothetical protein [Streptomyces sp. YS415]
MIKGWGAAASITLAVVAAAGVSGCGGDAEADAKKPAAASAKAPSFSKASRAFQDVAANAYLDDVCTTEAGTCWDKMNTTVDAARDLRKAMNAEKSVGPEFWTEAYKLIDTMEEGLAVGEDQGAPAGAATLPEATNRDDIFGSAHDLADWLDAHLIK